VGDMSLFDRLSGKELRREQLRTVGVVLQSGIAEIRATTESHNKPGRLDPVEIYESLFDDYRLRTEVTLNSNEV